MKAFPSDDLRNTKSRLARQDGVARTLERRIRQASSAPALGLPHFSQLISSSFFANPSMRSACERTAQPRADVSSVQRDDLFLTHTGRLNMCKTSNMFIQNEILQTSPTKYTHKFPMRDILARPVAQGYAALTAHDRESHVKYSFVQGYQAVIPI